MTADFAARARALLGTRFRAQGRSVSAGLDCVGLIIVAFGFPHDGFRRNYRLRGDHIAELRDELGRHFRTVRYPRPGDVLLLAVARDQLHLAIRTDSGFVHADAGIGRVVETPGPPKWPVAAAFRRRSRRAREA